LEEDGHRRVLIPLDLKGRGALKSLQIDVPEPPSYLPTHRREIEKIVKLPVALAELTKDKSKADPDMELIAEASDGEEAIKQS
jgi:hypothetical protein